MAQDLVPRHWTYDDLVAEFPEDNVRRELFDGELVVSPSPNPRHQRVVGHLFVALYLWAREHGGEAYGAPLDVKFALDVVFQPDVMLFREEHLDRIGEKFVLAAPDLVAEVSSPWSQQRDRVRKRGYYERFAVPEYWFVDLKRDRVEVFRLTDGAYPEPQVVWPGDVLTTPEAPGFALPVTELLGR